MNYANALGTHCLLWKYTHNLFNCKLISKLTT